MMLAIATTLLLAIKQEDSRSPVPGADSQRAAESLIRDVFKDDYAKRNTELPRKLLKQGIESSGEPAAQFALLREAKDLAVAGGDLDTALGAATELAARFQVDGPGLKSAAIIKVAPLLKSAEQFRRGAEACLALLEEALAQGQLETADKAAAAGSGLARKAKDVQLVNRIETRVKALASLKEEQEKVKQALQVLSSKPDDPAANGAVGHDLCLNKGDWTNGLKRLLKGSDASLREIAQRDLSGPSTPQEQVALGDAWWALAEKDGPRWKVRAAYWYVRVLPDSTGLTRAKLERRLAESGVAPPAGPGTDLLPLINPERDSKLGVWQIADKALVSPLGRLVRIQIPHVPPDEYDLHLTVERLEGRASLEIGLTYRGSAFHIGIDSWQDNDIAGLNMIDGKDNRSNETTFRGKLLPKDTPIPLVCSVRSSGVSLRAGDKLIFDWKGDPAQLTCHPLWEMPRKDMLFLGSWETRFRIKRLALLPSAGASGRGK